MVRRTPPMTGRLTLDDCLPDWPVAEPRPRRRRRPGGTRYHLSLYSDLRGQRIHGIRTSHIVTIPITGEYL